MQPSATEMNLQQPSQYGTDETVRTVLSWHCQFSIVIDVMLPSASVASGLDDASLMQNPLDSFILRNI